MRLRSLVLALLIGSPALAAPSGHEERPSDPPGRPARSAGAFASASAVGRGGFRSIQVNVDALGNDILGDAANEPSMAIDPTDPRNIVIGWRQFDTVASNFRQAGVAYSHDGGETWTFSGVLQPGQFRSDPVLAADSQGNFFYYSLSSTTTAEMFVSTDKGVTWTGPIGAFGGDKTWMAADTTGGTGNDNLYAIWNSQYTCCAAGTDLTRSTNGAQSFDGPFATPSKPKWGVVDVGPDGRVFVVGTRLTATSYPLPHLLLSSANFQNAGQSPTFDRVTGITLGGETTTGGAPNPGGLMGQVWVAVDRSSGATRGNVYVLGSIDPAGSDPMDVSLARSTDGGLTFGPAVRVNDRDPDSWQWMGTLAVAPDGRIDVVWDDTRTDPSGRVSEVRYAYSTDAGATWSRGIAVTPAFDSTIGWPNQNKMGDYYHLISDLEGASLAFAATFRGGQDVYFLRVGDCNGNGRHDAKDLSLGSSADCDLDGNPDECQDRVVCLGCNVDGTCQRGENCESCPSDCATSQPACGNGICEPARGEDCLSCASDCNGVQGGNPGSRYCCGDGDGLNPVGCADARCSQNGRSCVAGSTQTTCCGDGFCDASESSSTCVADCVVGKPGEASNLRVANRDAATGRLDLLFDPACDARQHTIYSGPLSSVGGYDYTAAACGRGISGSASFVPDSGSVFFLIVGNDGVSEGSYGTNGSGAERPEDTGTPSCDLPQTLTGILCE